MITKDLIPEIGINSFAIMKADRWREASGVRGAGVITRAGPAAKAFLVTAARRKVRAGPPLR